MEKQETCLYSTSHNLKTFNLEGSNLKLVDLQPNLVGGNKYNVDEDLKIDFANLLIQVNPLRFERNPNYRSVSYILILAKGGAELAYNSYLFVLNERGEIILQLNRNYPLTNYAVTENGKYLVFPWQKTNTVDEKIITERGYTIYDIENKETIIDKPMSDGFNINSIDTVGNVIQIKSGCGREDKFIFIDFKKRKIYSKIYNVSDRAGILEINEQGIIFIDRTETFEEDYLSMEF